MQFLSLADEPENLLGLEKYIRQAAARGCRLVVLPETAYYRGRLGEAPPDRVPGRASAFLCRLARELDIWIHGGTITEGELGSKCRNTAIIVNSAGEIAATYRKIHLFDIVLPHLQVSESQFYDPGDALTVIKVDDFTMGIVTCFDLRFPELWAALRRQGVEVFLLAANFTFRTGEAHWETLIRARAIENQCYVVAAAQWGSHPGLPFPSYGHALVADPWGNIVAEAGAQNNGLAVAEISRERIEEVRRQMPLETHRKPELYRG